MKNIFPKRLTGWFLIFILTICASGCATPYRVDSGRPVATIKFGSKTGAGMGWNHYLWVGAMDEQCNPSPRGGFLVNKLETDADPMTPSVSIMAGELLCFTMEYAAPYYGRHKSCSVTGYFTPESGGEYKALIHVAHDVDSCNLALVRRDGEEEKYVSDLVMPEFVCNKDASYGPMRNGQALHLKYEVYIIPAPM